MIYGILYFEFVMLVSFQIDFTLISVVLVASLLFSLVSSLTIIPLLRFQLSRYYGLYLFILYAAFLTVALLVETDVITGSV